MPEASALVTPTRLGAWLRTARARLCEARLPDADAERLAARALGLSWSELWSHVDEPVPVPGVLEALLVRRLSGEPLAYIEGSAVFWGREIVCGPGVLVPRPETETLVEVGLELVSSMSKPLIVDVGTGTGCVALAIALEREDALVVATEIDPDALAYASRNLAGSGVHLVRADLLGGIGRADLVVSNPPYVAEDADLPADVRSEPDRALLAGPDGDDVIDRLLAEVAARGDSHLAVEIGAPDQAERVQRRLGGGAWLTSDHTGRPRVVSV